jgi:Holliday junction resolvase RusA-like endonuclease
MTDIFKYKGKPVAKPRMVRSDKYKQRPVVMNYWAFKSNISAQAKKAGFKLGNAYRVTFIMPFPKSLPEKKRDEYRGNPHMIRPDIDNMLKSVNDCLLEEDSAVHYVVCKKVWGDDGEIILENFPENLDF